MIWNMKSRYILSESGARCANVQVADASGLKGCQMLGVGARQRGWKSVRRSEKGRQSWEAGWLPRKRAGGQFKPTLSSQKDRLTDHQRMLQQKMLWLIVPTNTRHEVHAMNMEKVIVTCPLQMWASETLLSYNLHQYTCDKYKNKHFHTR